jgi:hypothetical protein
MCGLELSEFSTTVHTMRLLFLVLICVISCGCRDEAEPRVDQTSRAQPQAAVKLRVMVVDDAELAKGIELLAGEWSERSGGEFAVVASSLDELLVAERPAADVIIYPSRQMGELVMRGWLRRVRPSVLADPALGWGDFLTAVRDQVVRFGGDVYALPLGDLPLAVGWRGELPDKRPSTWEQFVESNVGLDQSGKSPFPLTREFVARAVALTSPADRATLFFDPQTMDARLTMPQLVRALEWLAASAKKAEGPSANVVLPRDADELTLSPLLPAEEVYTASLERWDLEEKGDVPAILGFAGRLVSVTTTSRNAASAFKLIPWLTSGNTGTELSQRSPATLWCRASQVSKATSWFRSEIDDDRNRWLTVQLSRGDAYLLPRIPGIDSYVAELESAVRIAVAGEQPAGRALAAAESRWDTLTDSLGRDEQRAAFNRHLGLSE